MGSSNCFAGIGTQAVLHFIGWDLLFSGDRSFKMSLTPLHRSCAAWTKGRIRVTRPSHFIRTCVWNCSVYDVRVLLRLSFPFRLSWLPLIRPFNYQSVLIPILPNTMFSFLEVCGAWPVFYVTLLIFYQGSGTIHCRSCSRDDGDSYERCDCCGCAETNNYDSNTNTYDTRRRLLVRLFRLIFSSPYWNLCWRLSIRKKKVEREMEKLKISKVFFVSVLIFGSTNSNHKKTNQTTKFLDQRDLGRIVKLFTEFFNSLFQNFHQHTLRDLTDPQKPITVFLKVCLRMFDHTWWWRGLTWIIFSQESFLSSCYEEENLFLMPFLETQIFFHFSDECLRKRDMHEIPLVKSQSAPTGLHYIRDSGSGGSSSLSKSPGGEDAS